MDSKCHTYDLGTHSLDANCGFYFAPCSNPEGIARICVDRTTLIPEPARE